MMEHADNFRGKTLLSFSFDRAFLSHALLILSHLRRVSNGNFDDTMEPANIAPVKESVSGSVKSRSNAGWGQFHTYAINAPLESYQSHHTETDPSLQSLDKFRLRLIRLLRKNQKVTMSLQPLFNFIVRNS
jgi:hypothetical protein